MALNYFGTTLAGLASEVFGITLSASSVPTLTNGEAAYDRRVADVNGFLRSLQVDPAGVTDSESETYGIAALICEHEGKAYLYQATRPDEQGLAQAQFHLDQADAKRAQLRKRMSELGDGASSTAGRLQSTATTERRNTRSTRAALEPDRLTRWLGDRRRP